MNRKLSKEIRRKAIGLQLEWVQSLLDAEEAEKITRQNLEQFLPNQTHLWAHGQFYNSAFSIRHIIRTLKKMIRRNPLKDRWKVYDITLKEFMDNIQIK